VNDFNARLANEIPKLRRYARALRRDAVEADDLVQDCLLRAIRKCHLWQQGTDLRAWLFTIMHNEHVNHLRRRAREGVKVDIEKMVPMLAIPPSQDASLQLCDLQRAVIRLPEPQRQVLLLTALEGRRYDEAAATLEVPVSIVRSRLSRARATLRVWMSESEERSPGGGSIDMPRMCAVTAKRLPFRARGQRAGTQGGADGRPDARMPPR
jgi:RNA polymerase sigma-70 factor, ECF subfamily